MKRPWLNLFLLATCGGASLNASSIMYCSTNGGGFVSGCAGNTVFNTLANSLDWGAPTSSGSWAAHPFEAGFGQALNTNTFDASASNWQAVGSDATNIGLGIGPAGASSKVLMRVDDGLKMYDPTEFPAGSHWGNLGTGGTYYQNYSFFDGHGNSVPIQTTGGAFDTNGNHTDQYMGNTNLFYDHSAGKIPYVGDHLVGWNVAQDQQTLVTFNRAGQGVDEVAFQILGRSNTQNANGTVSSQWNTAGGGATPFNIMEILVRAYAVMNPTALDTPIFTYEILVGGDTPGFGECIVGRSTGGTGMDQSVPVPCNDAPIIDIKGTKGIFNIRSIVISSSTDAGGFFLNELYYDQTGFVGTPEPTELFLIGSGLIVTALLAKRRGLIGRR
jgi:hypothetical protein